MASGSGDGGSGNRLAYGHNPSPPAFLNPFNTNRNEMNSYAPGLHVADDRSNRIGVAPFSSHFTFSGGPFLPPSSSQSTNNNTPFTDSGTTFGSISPQQYVF